MPSQSISSASPETSELVRREAADLSPDDVRRLGHALVDRIADFLASVRDRPVAPALSPREVRALLDADRALPDAGEDPGHALAHATDVLFSSSTLNGHPRFFGYITSSAAPLGMLADLLAAAVNPNVGAWALSPVATEIERQTVRWIAELLGFPVDCGGLLLSGGNMANLVCALAALRAQAAWDVRAEGIAHGGTLTMYCSDQTHTWIEKAADLSGLGQRAVRRVATDAEGRMQPSALREQIAADRRDGATPAFVAVTAGTVSTGVVDPIAEIAEICRAEPVWLHVDGAYGAPAAALPDAPRDLKALGLADSIAVDPHKWLYAPLEAGCALVRNPELLHRAYRFQPPYYRFGGAADDPPTNYHEWGPQNSRGFRALKVWLGLRHAGRDGITRAIANDIALARAMHRHVAAHPELEAWTCALSITTFRYVPPSLRARGAEPNVARYLDDLNAAVLTETQRRGAVYLSNAVVGGRFLLRACIVNFRTTADDVAIVPELVAEVGREVDARLRPSLLE